MKKVIFLSTLFFYSCYDQQQEEKIFSLPKADCQISVSRSILTSPPDYYVFAYHGAHGGCGTEFLSPDNINSVIQTEGGANISCAFCCKTDRGYRVFTARHTFVGCQDSSDMKIENTDVISMPFSGSISGFEIAKPLAGSCVTLKGFRATDRIEWVEITGTLQRGSLEDVPKQVRNPVTWNSDTTWLIQTNDDLRQANLKGLSGAPVFNSEGKVVAVFSGVYPIRNGKYLKDGTYLRIEELQK